MKQIRLMELRNHMERVYGDTYVFHLNSFGCAELHWNVWLSPDNSTEAPVEFNVLTNLTWDEARKVCALLNGNRA